MSSCFSLSADCPLVQLSWTETPFAVAAAAVAEAKPGDALLRLPRDCLLCCELSACQLEADMTGSGPTQLIVPDVVHKQDCLLPRHPQAGVYVLTLRIPLDQGSLESEAAQQGRRPTVSSCQGVLHSQGLLHLGCLAEHDADAAFHRYQPAQQVRVSLSVISNCMPAATASEKVQAC